MPPIISTIGLVLLAAVSTASTPDPVPSPGEIKIFKDWAVGCDNGGVCQAVSLLANEGDAGFDDWGGPITLVRTADQKDILKVRVLVQTTDIDRYQMTVDGQRVDTGPIIKGDTPIEIVGQDALKVASAIARGRNLTVTGPGGKSLTKVSLAGSLAALRYIDQQQNRMSTRSALVAKGRKSFTPLNPVIPKIVVRHWDSAKRIPETTRIVELVENSECKDERYGVVEDQIFPMGQKDNTFRALVLISCGSGAYNFASAAYIGEITGNEKDGADWNFKPASFDRQPGWSGEGRTPLLVNAFWDADDQTLSSFSKGRGLGDCGNAERYVWDGERFRLIEASSMNECRGAYEWITTWRASFQKAENSEVQKTNVEKLGEKISEETMDNIAQDKRPKG